MDSELSPKAAEIAACARSLIALRGYNGFSYADIAEAVGISKASVHHHFATKAELACRVVADYRAEASAGLAALTEQLPDPAARLQAWVGFWQRCLRERTLPFCISLPALMPRVGQGVVNYFSFTKYLVLVNILLTLIGPSAARARCTSALAASQRAVADSVAGGGWRTAWLRDGRPD